MVKIISSTTVLVLVLAATLLGVMPVAAINTAIYGDTAGFSPDLHRDTFTVVYSLPGTAGSDLDANVAHYTNASTDVIFIGGDTSFGANTASGIEEAVSAGKILVVSEKNFRNFPSSIPVQNTGNVPESLYIWVANPNTTFSQDIFAGLGARFQNLTPLSGRSQYATKAGAVTLMSFDNDDPALLYTSYGKGFVIAWVPSSVGSYLTSTESDAINERLITHLLAVRGPISAVTTQTTTVPQTTVPATSSPTTIPANITTTPVPAISSPTDQARGTVSIYSSPLGATVFIDGAYQGITPLNLTAVAPGSHALKMAMDGYYDYDSTIYVISGGVITAFGTLPPRGNTAVVVTIAPTITPEVTATPGSILESPAVVAAILGIMTAIIGAIATIYSIYHKNKGEKEK
jgi:hypothetical protein